MKKLINIYIIGLVLSLLAVSCKNDYGDDEKFPQGGDFKIINSANKVGLPLAVYYDDNKVFDQFLFNTQTSYFRVKDSTPGSIMLNKVSSQGETNLLTINDSFELNKNVTYFLINDTSASGLAFIKANDDVIAANFGFAKIRIANLSSDLNSNVDVIVDGKTVISNIALNKVSDFVSVASGKTITVVKTGTATALKTVASNLIASTKIYTLVLNGYATSGSIPALTLTPFANTL